MVVWFLAGDPATPSCIIMTKSSYLSTMVMHIDLITTLYGPSCINLWEWASLLQDQIVKQTSSVVAFVEYQHKSNFKVNFSNPSLKNTLQTIINT